ncbi:MAG TPA: hypothetical protein VEJ87_08585, partial [Acidimicrobiales bacterium]|nr:hypothetical protein [Acidimicrobiales bacterium]
MVELIVVGFIAGVVAGISPCILPVLPVVFAVGATTPQTSTDGSEQARRPVENAEDEPSPPAVAGTSAARSAKTGDVETTVLATNTDKGVGARPSGSFRRWWSERSRAVSVAIGLVLSFSLLILAGSEIISLLHLPEGFLKDAGIAVLLVLGVGLLVPKVGEILEKP